MSVKILLYKNYFFIYNKQWIYKDFFIYFIFFFFTNIYIYIYIYGHINYENQWKSLSPITITSQSGVEFEGSIINLIHQLFTKPKFDALNNAFNR